LRRLTQVVTSSFY